MKKSLITAILLIATSAAAHATAPDCNPASGNWVNAAPTTCRFISRDVKEVSTLPTPVRELPNETPTDEVPVPR